MKKTVYSIITVLMLALLLLPVLSACNNGARGTSGGDRLVIYNWEDYIDSDILDEFADYYQETTGRALSITYTTFDTNETMMTKVLKGDANVDLICPSEYAIEKLLTEKLLLNHNDVFAEIQPDLTEYGVELNNLSSLRRGYGALEPAVMDVITSMFSSVEQSDGNTVDMTEYMVPYMYGTLGILYNTSVLSIEELETYGWGVLWNVQENEQLENKILMKDSVRDSYAAAIFYMYEYNLLPEKYKDYTVQQLINCTDDEMVACAEEVLTKQRDHISGYEVDFGKDDMINEIVYADFAWSGDALWAIEEGDYDEESDTYQLGYFVPSVASNIWYDGWVIPTSVNNKLAAMMFLDYMCAPERAIRNSLAIGYTCATSKELIQNNEEAISYIEENEYDLEEYFENEGRFPQINETLGVMRDFGKRNEVVVQMWQRAKSGGHVAVELWYIILAIVLGIALCFGIYALSQALKRRPRKVANK